MFGTEIHKDEEGKEVLEICGIELDEHHLDTLVHICGCIIMILVGVAFLLDQTLHYAGAVTLLYISSVALGLLVFAHFAKTPTYGNSGRKTLYFLAFCIGACVGGYFAYCVTFYQSAYKKPVPTSNVLEKHASDLADAWENYYDDFHGEFLFEFTMYTTEDPGTTFPTSVRFYEKADEHLIPDEGTTVEEQSIDDDFFTAEYNWYEVFDDRVEFTVTISLAVLDSWDCYWLWDTNSYKIMSDDASDACMCTPVWNEFTFFTDNYSYMKLAIYPVLEPAFYEATVVSWTPVGTYTLTSVTWFYEWIYPGEDPWVAFYQNELRDPEQMPGTPANVFNWVLHLSVTPEPQSHGSECSGEDPMLEVNTKEFFLEFSFNDVWIAVLATSGAITGVFSLFFSNTLPKRQYKFSKTKMFTDTPKPDPAPEYVTSVENEIELEPDQQSRLKNLQSTGDD